MPWRSDAVFRVRHSVFKDLSSTTDHKNEQAIGVFVEKTEAATTPSPAKGSTASVPSTSLRICGFRGRNVHKKPLRPGSTQRVTKGCFRGHSRHHHTSNRAIEGMYSLSRRKIRRTRHTGFDCPMQQSQILISQDQAVPAMQSIVLNRRIMPGIE